MSINSAVKRISPFQHPIITCRCSTLPALARGRSLSHSLLKEWMAGRFRCLPYGSDEDCPADAPCKTSTVAAEKGQTNRATGPKGPARLVVDTRGGRRTRLSGERKPQNGSSGLHLLSSNVNPCGPKGVPMSTFAK